MSAYRVDWHGSFPALMTPFTPDGDLDEALLRANVRLALEEGVHGVIVCGHNGEAHVMTREERKRVTAIGVEEVGGRVPVVSGTGGIRTDDVIALTQDARDVGADGAMIEPPYFLTPRARDVTEHYARIGDAVGLPIMIYNNPKRTGIDMPPDHVEEIIDAVSMVAAIKDSSFTYDRILDLIHQVGDRMRIFVGPARVFGFQGIQMGAHGFVDELQQILGRDGARLYDLAVANDWQQGIPIQKTAYRLHRILMAVPNSYPAPIKDAMRLLGRPGGYPRRPLRPMSEPELKQFASQLASLGLMRAEAAD